jgi:hypothetical protein
MQLQRIATRTGRVTLRRISCRVVAWHDSSFKSDECGSEEFLHLRLPSFLWRNRLLQHVAISTEFLRIRSLKLYVLQAHRTKKGESQFREQFVSSQTKPHTLIQHPDDMIKVIICPQLQYDIPFLGVQDPLSPLVRFPIPRMQQVPQNMVLQSR